jgi:hypothetical protein
MPGGSAVTGQSEAIDLADIAAGLPRLIHEVAHRHIADPDHVALIKEGGAWTYRGLDRSVAEIEASLCSLGVRPGESMIIVNETASRPAGFCWRRTESMHARSSPTLDFRHASWTRSAITVAHA